MTARQPQPEDGPDYHADLQYVCHPEVNRRSRPSWVGDLTTNVQRQGQLLVAVTQPDGKLPERQNDGDAGYDLYVSRDAVIAPGFFVDVQCGIRIQLPAGYWGRITGRSSTLRRRSLLVNEAVIDNGYIGEIYTGIWNLGSFAQKVYAGERLAQLILHPIVAVKVQQVEPDDLHSRDGRGTGGFGSTGV